jgi:hypothetical protein
VRLAPLYVSGKSKCFAGIKGLAYFAAVEWERNINEFAVGKNWTSSLAAVFKVGTDINEKYLSNIASPSNN